MKKALALFATILLFSFTAFAQNTASATSDVTATIAKGLAISNIGGSLDFGEIIATSASQNQTITPASGAEFRVVGHPAKSVTINFNDVTLDNDSWVTDNGGTNSTMTFTPNVEHTGGNSSYLSGTTVSDGNSVALVHQTGTGNGYLYLWVGGQLDIAGNQANGDYTGTFTVTVTY